MIELANDPKASPPGWRASAGREGRRLAPEVKPGRINPNWPFPSRYSARPAQQDPGKPSAKDSSGS